MNRNRSGSIRNITAHLINDKNTSIAEACIVFIGASAGNNPRRIYWSYNFFFFDPGTLDPEAGRRGPGCQNLAFQRFDPMILCSLLWRIRWLTLESHSSKQMIVHEQITIFIKKIIFHNFFGSKRRFFGEKKNGTGTGLNRNRIEPEPV